MTPGWYSAFQTDPASCRPPVGQAPKLLFGCRSQQKGSQLARRINVMEIAPCNIMSFVIFCPQDIIFALYFSKTLENFTYSCEHFLKLEKDTGFWF